MINLLLALSSFLVTADPALPEKAKVGVVLSMTGDTAAFGDMTWTGIQIAKEMKPKVLGADLELVLVDNKSDKIEAANAAQRVVQRDKVIAILGEVASSRSMAISSVAESKKIPQISPSSTNPLVTQGKRYVFRACFIDPFQGQVIANFALQNLKAKTAALLTDIAQDYSVGLSNYFKTTFEKGGGKVIKELRYQTNDQDFSPQLTVLKGTPPDVLVITGYYQEAALVSKQARGLGLKSTILGGDGAEAPELLKLGGEAVEGFYFSTHFDEKSATTAIGRKYVEAYRAKFNKAPDALGALGADAYFMLAEAIEKAKSFEPEKIRDELEKMKGFEAVSGIISMDEKHNAVKSAVVKKVEKGEFVYVTTVNP
ncbi:MAG: ABC transporter substrate-binding protein [Nitrospirae bacterium]|nr:ABC transporter substrate-binding protein [Nitrospirota bacterium]